MKDVVSTSQGGKRYKRINLFANVLFSLVFAGFIGSNIYEEMRTDALYDSISMSFLSIKEVEYGTKDVDTTMFIENIDNGELVNYTKEIDTSKVGVQTLSYDVSLEDVNKNYLINVSVKDTKAPVINIKKSLITVYKGTNFKFLENIKSVSDEIDGELKYVESVPEVNENGYYTISSNFNKNSIGSYPVKIKAVDKNGNAVEASYTIKVINKPVARPVVKTVAAATYNVPTTVDTSSVVSAALSFVGKKYVKNAANPSVGFDCSGLVYYVYKLFGYSLPRTTTGLIKVGSAVSEDNMQPGDIIVWSDNGLRSPTHVAIYIGGGKMVHAANKRLGVIVHQVSYWKSGGKNKIMSIRRV